MWISVKIADINRRWTRASQEVAEDEEKGEMTEACSMKKKTDQNDG